MIYRGLTPLSFSKVLYSCSSCSVFLSLFLLLGWLHICYHSLSFALVWKLCPLFYFSSFSLENTVCLLLIISQSNLYFYPLLADAGITALLSTPDSFAIGLMCVCYT